MEEQARRNINKSEPILFFNGSLKKRIHYLQMLPKIFYFKLIYIRHLPTLGSDTYEKPSLANLITITIFSVDFPLVLWLKGLLIMINCVAENS